MKKTTQETTNWHKDHKQSLTLGQRAADKMRNSMGSWGFVFGFLAFMGLWAIVNIIAWINHFDPYPFTFLNLLLSTLAGLQGAILLIAAKRQDEVSQALAENDYQTNIASKKEIEALQKSLARIENEKLDEILKLLKTTKKK